VGCDIHMYAEFRRDGSEHWWGIGKRWNPGRNYSLFGHLAGVRSVVDPVVEPRGFPEDAAWAARDDYHYYVAAPGSVPACDEAVTPCDADKTPRGTFQSNYGPAFDFLEENGFDETLPLLFHDLRRHGNSCDLATAERWVGSGSSRWIEGPHEPTSYGTVGIISDPDAHTASWLTLAELKRAVKRCGAVGFEYHAMVAMLSAMQKRGCETRVVFFFDN
jgi:hypothetical protein